MNGAWLEEGRPQSLSYTYQKIIIFNSKLDQMIKARNLPLPVSYLWLGDEKGGALIFLAIPTWTRGSRS
jgi:hypothetical protein